MIDLAPRTYGWTGAAMVAGLAILPLYGEVAFPADQVKAGADLVVDLPDLGMSASSRGTEPVRARAVFPEDWERQRKHPVFVQLHGSYGSNRIEEPWPEIFGRDGWIYLAVDYPVTNPYPSGLSNAQQALEMLRAVAVLDEDRLVAGGNASGAYSICHGLHSGLGSDFDAFILVAGGTEQGRTAKRLGERPLLVIEGGLDTEKRRQTTSRLLDSLNGAKHLTHVVVEGMSGKWPPRDHPSKPDEVLRAEVVEMIRKWLIETAMVAGAAAEPIHPAEPDAAALAARAAADEKAFRYAAALEGYRKLRNDPAAEVAAEAAIARILARREELLRKAESMRPGDPEGAEALLVKIAEVFGEEDEPAR